MHKTFLLLLVISTFLYSQQKPLPAIAVCDLTSQGINQRESNSISVQLCTALQKTGKFHVVERTKMLEICKKQKRICTTDSCLLKIGKLLGLNTIVAGSLGGVLAVRILDVETGNLIACDSVNYRIGMDSGTVCKFIEKLVRGFFMGINKSILVSARQENVADVKRLLADGADVNTHDSAGSTPLHIAAAEGNAGLVKLLIGNAADLNAADNLGLTPLHYTAIAGKAAIIGILLDNGSNINAKDIDGFTPMDLAKEHNDVMAVLKSHGAQ
jgi:hypothetical protein